MDAESRSSWSKIRVDVGMLWFVGIYNAGVSLPASLTLRLRRYRTPPIGVIWGRMGVAMKLNISSSHLRRRGVNGGLRPPVKLILYLFLLIYFTKTQHKP